MLTLNVLRTKATGVTVKVMNYPYNWSRNSETSDVSNGVSVFLTLTTGLLSVLTLSSNIVLAAVIIRTPPLHTQTNALIISMVVSELLTGAFVMPFSAVIWMEETWIFSAPLCEFVGVMWELGSSSKSLTMMSIAIDRCIAISQPLQYSKLMNKKTTALLVVYVWLQAAVFAIIPVIGWGRYVYIYAFYQCIPDIYHSVSFTSVSNVLCDVIPAVVLVIASVVIVLEARTHHRVTVIAQLAIAMYSGPAAGSGINYSRTTLKAMRTFFIITVTYLVDSVPRTLYRMIVTADNDVQSAPVAIATTLLSFVCCVVTPITIATSNRKFKESIRLMFKRKHRVMPTTGAECDTYTITTGLHSVLEASFAVKYVPGGQKRLETPGPSGVFTASGVAARKISVLLEVHSSSSSTPNNVDVIHTSERHDSPRVRQDSVRGTDSLQSLGADS